MWIQCLNIVYVDIYTHTAVNYPNKMTRIKNEKRLTIFDVLFITFSCIEIKRAPFYIANMFRGENGWWLISFPFILSGLL